MFPILYIQTHFKGKYNLFKYFLKRIFSIIRVGPSVPIRLSQIHLFVKLGMLKMTTDLKHSGIIPLAVKFLVPYVQFKICYFFLHFT